MNRKQLILTVAALLIMVGGAAALVQLKAKQRLGSPGVLTRPIPDRRNLEVLLPERVLDYASAVVPTEKRVTDTLPADTSFGARLYTNAGGLYISGSVVLMGTDRTSLHKPQYCLQGDGWQITSIERITIPVPRPFAYELPAAKILVTRQRQLPNGQTDTINGVYIYWYVADRAFSGDPDGRDRMWSMAEKLLKTGELQRWAYVAFLAACPPGEEDTTYARMREFISAAVPEFQITQPEKEIAVSAN